MIIPCIDLMGGRVVQLVRGEKKALEREDALAMLDEFAGFPEIQVIDLDAALGQGSNDLIVRALCARVKCRVGGGVRSVARAADLAAAGAFRIIVGTAAFSQQGIRHEFLRDVAAAVGSERLMLALDSRGGRIAIKGWKESIDLTAEDVVKELEPYCGEFLCTFVDREGTMTGTDLDWFARLRAATSRPITAAGGIHTHEEVRALTALHIHCAIGMAVYTGTLKLADLSRSAEPPRDSQA